MIIEISDDSSMVKWKMNDNEDWKSAEISDLIKAYESPKVTVFAENASKEEIEDFKQELENVLERPQGEIFPMEIVAGTCPFDANGDCQLRPHGEWIRKCNENRVDICCTNCGYDDGYSCFKYCPNCGADMRKGGAV